MRYGHVVKVKQNLQHATVAIVVRESQTGTLRVKICNLSGEFIKIKSQCYVSVCHGNEVCLIN